MQPTTNVTSEPTAYATPQFVDGQLTRLRPVLDADLPAMARLMAEAARGFSWEREPWTVQRLGKEFEDEKKPGLWHRDKRFFAITDHAGALVGVLMEEQERSGRADIELHIAKSRTDRDALGPDALATYVEYKRSWQHCPRISTCVLEVQVAERAWLLACGFTHEMHCAEAWLYQGQVVAFDIYAWIPQWVRDNRAPDGIGQ